ncbi:MAG: type II secretion system F family protein [Rhodoferax sp.]|nr:type II secretion system F family protein [Rhodoferax sp.]
MTGNFELVVRTVEGRVQTLDVSAADATAACARAVRDGLQVLGCSPRGGAARTLGHERTAKRMGLDIANFSYELASLMAAGLSVVDALRTLAAKDSAPSRRAALLDVVQGLSEGLPLSAALERHPGRYPALLIATVSASEQTGELSTSLRRYAEHQQTIKTLRDKVVGSAVYPMLLLAVGCVVVLFLITVVVPKFAVLIESTRRELPWSSQLLMSWGRFAALHAWEVGLVGVALLVALLTAVRHILRNGARAAWLDAVPLIGPTVRQFRHAQLYRTTGMLVRGGIAAPRALQLGASLLGDADRERLHRAVQLLHEGFSLSSALQTAQLADPVATSMLAVAERTGALADILERIAQFHESGLQRSVELASRLFEPVLMIVIGLVVGAIVVLMYLPIFDLASSLQ